MTPLFLLSIAIMMLVHPDLPILAIAVPLSLGMIASVMWDIEFFNTRK